MSPATTGTHQAGPRLLSLTKSTRGARVIRKQLRRAHAANNSPGLDALETVWNVQSEGRGEGGRRDDIATIQRRRRDSLRVQARVDTPMHRRLHHVVFD